MSGYDDPSSGNSDWGRFSPETHASDQWLPVPLTPRFRRIGLLVRISLRLLAVLLVAEVALYAWGLSMFEDAASTGNVNQLRFYDDLDRATSVAALVLLAAAGISWMVWQFQLAKSASGHELRRRPGWHAWAWITPVVGLWFPYQNVKDLWRRRFPDVGGALLGWWWAAFVVSTVLDRVVAHSTTDSVADLESAVRLELVSTLINLLALVLAVRIHRALSDAEEWRFRGPVSPAASPAV